ncbi:hypothetical protein GGX14DRAFT_657915 [Mycena pura]|uniref:Uncharacterized protein n=1 Tax=Mycena pura TaxID=153505 RepID=A0AAD6YLW5_9AGAR|nr:hypothetical protein GGX14DRAFT_657915 [Mycena pura]
MYVRLVQQSQTSPSDAVRRGLPPRGACFHAPSLRRTEHLLKPFDVWPTRSAPQTGDAAPPHHRPHVVASASSPPATAAALPAAVSPTWAQLAASLARVVAEGGGRLVLLDVPMLSAGSATRERAAITSPMCAIATLPPRTHPLCPSRSTPRLWPPCMHIANYTHGHARRSSERQHEPPCERDRSPSNEPEHACGIPRGHHGGDVHFLCSGAGAHRGRRAACPSGARAGAGVRRDARGAGPPKRGERRRLHRAEEGHERHARGHGAPLVPYRDPGAQSILLLRGAGGCGAGLGRGGRGFAFPATNVANTAKCWPRPRMHMSTYETVLGGTICTIPVPVRTGFVPFRSVG